MAEVKKMKCNCDICGGEGDHNYVKNVVCKNASCTEKIKKYRMERRLSLGLSPTTSTLVTRARPVSPKKK